MASNNSNGFNQAVLQRLLAEKNVRIEKHLWSEELRTELTIHLKQQHIEELVIYRLKETGDYIACIQGFQPNSADIETTYIKRHNILLVLPILAIVLIVFAFTALIARDLKAMLSAEFLIFTPFFIGALSQYFCSYQQMNKVGAMLSQQAVVLLTVIVLSVFVLKEGTICVIMASPLIYLWQVFGAIAMRVICNSIWTPTAKVYSLAMVPLIVLLLDPFSSSTSYNTTKNEIIIDASVNQVFDAINNIQNIKSEEIKKSPIFWMGFPKPESGMTVADGDGFTRQIHWQRGIYFEEKITHNQPNQLLAWTYRFTPESFPKGALDDHLEIGGEYFDLASTDYRLESIGPNQTKLTLTIDYRLSTEINWYSKPWANYVLNQFSDVVLNIYKKRLEQTS